jgi:hypothetical protein
MMSWSKFEVEATVVDYFHMLIQELTGQAYNKSTHRKALMHKLDKRSEGAIERKHQNISAILIALGCPYIRVTNRWVTTKPFFARWSNSTWARIVSSIKLH